MKKKNIYYSIIFILIILLFIFIKNTNTTVAMEENNLNITEYYNDTVITTNDSIIYDNNLEKIGYISKGIELTLDGIIDNYFIITNLDDNYYIKYSDVKKIDKLSINDDRFEKYIVFNENIVTQKHTNFYDENDNLIFSINKGYNLPIIIKEKNKYGVKFANRLLYIHKDDGYIIENNNKNDTNTNGIAILNYHFIYKDNDKDCNQEICISESQFREHLSYIKDNNYFTPTMKELEMYIDGKIQLPKSVVITADDGGYAENYKRLLEEYQLNGTLFLISGWFNIKDFQSDYMELHSHTNDMHDVGDCPTGQGGAIQCFKEEDILNDLKTTREKLNNTTYFAYPFYEYNDYSIKMLKEAGFTMAFGGEYENGELYVRPGIDKFKLPRWVIVNYTTMDTFKSYLNLGDGR